MIGASGRGTARYLVRHALWRTFTGVLAAGMEVTGLLVLALVGVAVWALVRWPTVTVVVLVLLWWRRRNRARMARDARSPEQRERERLAVEVARVKMLSALAKVDPDVLAADRDYREGRISRRDWEVALEVAAERAREARRTSRFRFR